MSLLNGGYMRRSISRYVLFVVPVLVLCGCPIPIDQQLLNQVKDVVGPVITILPPENESYYSSNVVIQGIVTDALSEAGGTGTVAGLSFDVLGSPIGGSSLAHRLDRSAITRPLLGRSGERGLLGGAPRWKGTRELGVIAGNRGIGVGMLLLGHLKPPHDGTVAVTETHTSDVTVHLQVPYSHFGMLYRPEVARALCAFLQTGDFSVAPETGTPG